MKKLVASKRAMDWAKKQSINAESMFGQDDGFFTRDDCIEFIEIPLEEAIRKDKSLGFQPDDPINLRCYIEEGNKLDVDCEVDGFFFNIKLDAPIDMRKIRKPSDLQKYIPEIFNKFKNEYSSCIESDAEDPDTEITASENIDREFKAVPLKTLKKGAWFTIKPIAEPTDKQVYIKDDYDREEKKFMCGRCDDISYSTYFSGSKLVYDDSNFEY